MHEVCCVLMMYRCALYDGKDEDDDDNGGSGDKQSIALLVFS